LVALNGAANLLKQPHEPISLGNFRRSQHFVEKPLNSLVETILARFRIKFDKLQPNQPFKCGRVNKLADNFWRDLGVAVFKEPLQCNPQVRLEDSEKTVFCNLHITG
jgi:hypothetical protein